MEHPLLTIRRTMGRLYMLHMEPVMTRFALTRMELDVLLFLGNNPEYDTAAEIVQLRDLTKSHVSKAVEHLTEMGLMTKTQDTSNRRRIHLALTDEAADALKAGQEAQQRFVEVLTKGLSAPERTAMRRVLDAMVSNARRALDASSEES